ncbi:LamG domain-containing protein, partial [Nonlabens sp.]|uniref:LamG domain-containing protein n=1 Tax=Nonlabens sp. TaxID=1888209 RepID=UPI0025DC6F40
MINNPYSQAQTEVSVPFNNGFIGVIGNNSQSANSIKTFTTLGIAQAFFVQQSTTSSFQLQGNDIPGNVRLQLTSGQIIEFSGAIVWRQTAGSTVKSFGFIPSGSITPINFPYSGGTYTINASSNLGLNKINEPIAYTDNTSESGNAATGANLLSALNSYLSHTQGFRPSGPVTVTSLTTSTPSPTISGQLTLGSGETFAVTVNGVLYTSANGLQINGNTWTLQLPSLTTGTYSVVATITNSAGYTLSDTTSGELVILPNLSTTATPRIISNRSLNFDATAGQTVDINPMIPYSSSYTVMGWVNIIGSFSNIFTWGSPITNNYFKIETNFSGKLRYYVPSGGAVVESTTIIKNSGWVHIAVTNNAGSITLYVNGVAENTGTETRIITPTTSSMGAALLNGSIQGSNNGTIDELSIWNSALTNVDINNFMRDSPDGTETGVVAFYDFNNIYITPGGDNTSVSQATILTDMSGNGYTGTLSSFSLNGPTGNWVTTQIPSFTACSGTASAEQTLTVSGTDLTADVIVTAPTNFEVSLTSGSGFASSVNITASGTLSATTVYVRVTNSATSGAISGSLTMSSIGATDQTVSLTGVVNAISLTPASQTNVSCNSGANGSAT